MIQIAKAAPKFPSQKYYNIISGVLEILTLLLSKSRQQNFCLQVFKKS